MTTSAALLVLGLLAAASAAPRTSETPICARECSIAGAPKLAYKPEKTYSYAYTGKSEIQMKDVEGGNTEMTWHAEVDLTWLSPCDMAITFKNPSFGGVSGAPDVHRSLTQYPLVVAMTDGRVQHVCSHPEDNTWSINLKKGVASALQNTLPSNSTINSGLNVTETGINGKCKTMYMVEHQGDKIIVEKKKNLRFCQERFTTQFEVPRVWHKAPLPMTESVALCKQEITRGIYTSIACEDKHVIKPTFGSYKYIKAKQFSQLRFQSESNEVPQAINNLQGELLHKTLKFDHETLKKDESKVPVLEQVLKEVCQKTQHGVEKETAYLVDKAIHLMRRIPERALEQIMQKVKSGEICSEKLKMEHLFLDAIAFVQEPNTVKLMVEEIMSGRLHGGRTALYVAALYLTPRPNLQAIEALKPLFESSEHHPMAALAAATLVNTYCKHYPHCRNQGPVKQVAEILSQKVQQQCTPGGEHTMKQALATLKALGNMGVMLPEVAKPVIRCMETKGVEKNVRVAAAQAFRNAKCHRENTRDLVRFAINHERDTEVRIASYLAVIKCAHEEDLKEIINKISKEENTQVRGFILSHLLNLHESNSPRKQDLKYLLSSFSIPANFTRDIRKYSRNIDMTYYAQSLGVGAGVESNIIYAPGSFIPRSVTLNLTSAFGNTPVNLGEYGVRVEGFDPILKDLFGPEGYFKKSSLNKIFHDLTRFAEEKGANILEHWRDQIRERRSIDMSTISHFLSQIYGQNHNMRIPKADFFARFSGQEFAYASLAGNMHNIDVDRLIESFFHMVQQAMHAVTDMQTDTVRTMQMDFDYTLPTTQGIPLKLKLDGTVVLGLQMESRLNNMDGVLKMKPSISLQVNGFLGFDSFLAKCGLKLKNTIGSNNGLTMKIKKEQGFEIELDLPQKMELIDFKQEMYLMKSVRGHETKVHPSGVRPVRVQHKDCMRSLEEKIGLKICYELDIPNIFRSEGLPLGPPMIAKVIMEKADSSMRGYQIKGNVQNNSGMKHMKVQVETAGSSTPKKAQAVMSYENQGEEMKMSAALATDSAGGIKVQFMKKWSESEKELQVKVYSSQSMHFSQDTEVVEGKLSMRNNGMDSQIHLLTQTKNALKQFIDHHWEVLGEIGFCHRSGLPYPKRLEKFDFRTIAGHYKMIAFVQKRSESEFETAIKIGSRHEDWFALHGTHNVEGNWNEGLALKTASTVKIGYAQFKGAFDMHYTRERKGVTMHLVRLEENKIILDFEMLLECPSQSHMATFKLDIPEVMRPIKFEINLQAQGSHQYNLHAALKHGHQLILQVEGPLTAQFTWEIKHLQGNVRMTTMESEPIRMEFSLLSKQNKQALAFEIKDQQQPAFAIEWTMTANNNHETKTAFKLLLPSIMDNKINAVITPKHIQLTFNNLVSPKSSSSRRVKGVTDVDFENKKIKVDFFWDADKDQNKKFNTELTFVSSPSNPQQTVIHGGWNFKGSQYHFKTELRCSNHEVSIFGRHEIKCELSTPSQRTYALDSTLQIAEQSPGVKVDSDIIYRDPQNREHKMKFEMTMAQLGRPFNFKFNTRAEVVSPEGQQSSISLGMKHEKTPNQREAYLQMRMRNPALNKPMQTSLKLMNQQTSCKLEWQIEVDSPADAALWELQITPEGGVQTLKVGVNMREIIALLKACYKVAGVQYVSGKEYQEDSSPYVYRYDRNNHHKGQRTSQTSGEGRESSENSNEQRDRNSGSRYSNSQSSAENINVRRDRQSSNGQRNSRSSEERRNWNSNEQMNNRHRQSGEDINTSSENLNLNEWNARKSKEGQWNSGSSGANRHRGSQNWNSNDEMNNNRNWQSSGEDTNGSSENMNTNAWRDRDAKSGQRNSGNSGENRRRSSENFNSNEELTSRHRDSSRQSSPIDMIGSSENMNLYKDSNRHSTNWQNDMQSSGEYGRRNPDNMQFSGEYMQKGSGNMQSSSDSWRGSSDNMQSSGEYMQKGTGIMQSSSEHWGGSSDNMMSNEQNRNRNRHNSGEYMNQGSENINFNKMKNNQGQLGSQSSGEYPNSNEQYDYNPQRRHSNRQAASKDNLDLYRNPSHNHHRGQWESPSSQENRSESSENSNSNEYGSHKRKANSRYSNEDMNEGSGNINLYQNSNPSSHRHHKNNEGSNFEYFMLYEKPTHTSHRMHVKTPSRSMESELRYSPSEYSVKFYPKKHVNEEKYELAVIHSGRSNPWEGETKYEGRFNHPGQERERKFEILYSHNQDQIQGRLILDIFVRPEDKITAQLQSTKMSRNSVRVEGTLRGNPLKIHPKFILNAAYDSHTVGFDVEFEKEPRSRPSLVISAKYDRSTGRNAAIAFIVKTEQGPMLDIAASMKPEFENDCSGVKFSAFARSALIGKYDVITKLCKPGYMKITTKKHGNEKAYIVRMGIQEIKNIEFSITEKEEMSQDYKYLSLVRVKLMSPTIVNLEAKWETEQVYSLWNTFSEKMSRLSSATLSWMDMMSQEVLKEGGNSSPSQEMARLCREAKEELMRIYEDLVYDKLMISYETLESILRGDFVHNLVSGYKKLWYQVLEFHKFCQEIVPRIISALKRQFETFTEVVNGVVYGGARWMLTGEMPEEMRRLIDQITESRILNEFCRWLEELLRENSEKYEVVKNIIHKIKQTLVQDLEKIREQLMAIPKVKETIKWLIHHLHIERVATHKVVRLINKVIQESLLSSLKIENGNVEIQIPLRRPVNSLTQALRYMEPNPIPVPDNILRIYETLTLRVADNRMWSFYNFIPRHVNQLVPPYNRTAMLVDGKEILTFDRSVLRAPISPCKVLLAAYKTTSVVMEHPQSSPVPQIIMKTRSATIVIKPNFNVVIDGSEMNGNHETKGKVQIWKNEQEIKIASPWMILRAYPKNNVISVEMNGWAFGEVVGLMGTFDGEKANDWFTSQGTRTKNLQELVRSWQENQSCQTPSIRPIDAAHTPLLRTLQCQTLLGVKSRCNPIVRPDPFMKMCYAARNPCNVVMAYHNLCSAKGVKEVFPLAC